MLAGTRLAGEVADHSSADQLPVEKNTRGTSSMFAHLHLTSSSVQSICDAEKVSARQFFFYGHVMEI